MKIVTFLQKKGDHPKRVVDFLLEKDTFRNKIKEIVEDFACEAKFLHFFISSFFFIFLFSIFTFFRFFHFFHFFIFFIFLLFFFSFHHFSSSFLFFFYFLGCSKSDLFFASIASRFLVTFLKKNIFLSRLGWYLFGPSFHFFFVFLFVFFSFSFL